MENICYLQPYLPSMEAYVLPRLLGFEKEEDSLFLFFFLNQWFVEFEIKQKILSFCYINKKRTLEERNLDCVHVKWNEILITPS